MSHHPVETRLREVVENCSVQVQQKIAASQHTHFKSSRFFVSPCTRVRWVDSFTHRRLYSLGKIPHCPLKRGWVGPRAGLDVMEKRKISCPCWESNLWRLANTVGLNHVFFLLCTLISAVTRIYSVWEADLMTKCCSFNFTCCTPHMTAKQSKLRHAGSWNSYELLLDTSIGTFLRVRQWVSTWSVRIFDSDVKRVRIRIRSPFAI